jgi:hypothetical protein|uniref:Uncharacterized protein n=1 Tax=Bionectria ochroleuca TaxID=29856 RepID=A0A8H7NGM7_BIOOC
MKRITGYELFMEKGQGDFRGCEARTEAVEERKGDGGAGGRPAAPVEQRLRVERGGPGDEVDPAKGGGDEGKKATGHGGWLQEAGVLETRRRTRTERKRSASDRGENPEVGGSNWKGGENARDPAGDAMRNVASDYITCAARE